MTDVQPDPLNSVKTVVFGLAGFVGGSASMSWIVPVACACIAASGPSVHEWFRARWARRLWAAERRAVEAEREADRLRLAVTGMDVLLKPEPPRP